MLPFRRPVAADFCAVDALIRRQLHSEVGLIEEIGGHIIAGGGKRLRPLTVLLAALGCGYRGPAGRSDGEPGAHVRLACIIEFIHTATLLHDDVVDLSERRRGRPTANAKWGNPPTVLVGDFLYSRAFQMLVELGIPAIMALLADATNTIAEGEVQQLLAAQNAELDEAGCLEVMRKKTAALFQAAAAGGALLAGQSEAVVGAMRDYGHHLGMALQLRDDVLDYSGDPRAMGKNTGDDLAGCTPTLPLVVALRERSAAERRDILAGVAGQDAGAAERVLAMVQGSGGVGYTQRLAEREAARAREAVGGLVDSVYKRGLVEMAGFVVGRGG